MKKILLVTLLIAAIFHKSLAQQPTKVIEQSNAEKFSDKIGILLQKEIIDVGVLKKCKFQIARFSDLIGGTKTSALRLEYVYSSSYGSSGDTKLALLDVDEIDGLLKSIKIIQSKVIPSVAENYTEVSFKSRSGFEAGCFSKKESWSTYLKLEKYDSNSYVFMEKDDLAELVNLLNLAKAKLL
jgi:hypothetical protein